MPQIKRLKTEEEEAEHEKSSSDESFSEGDNEDSCTSDSDEDEEDDNEEEIMIDFEARAMVESDLDSVRLLIQQKLTSFPSIDANEVATIVVQQENVGSVIYQAVGNEDEEPNEDDETLFGVISIIHLNNVQVKKFAAQFKQVLVKECQKADQSNAAKFENYFKTNSISYVVNERYINIPPNISLPMLESLVNDLKALNEAKTDEDKVADPDYWLFVVKHYVQAAGSDGCTKIYANPEEEVFEEFAEFKFELTNSKQKNAFDADTTPVVSVALVPYGNVPKCIDKIKTLIK